MMGEYADTHWVLHRLNEFSTEVTFGENAGFTVDYARQFAKKIPKLKRLYMIEFRECVFDDGSLDIIAAALGNNKHVREIHLQENTEKPFISTFLRALAKNETVKELKIIEGYMEEEDGHDFSEYLQKNTALHTLRFLGCNFAFRFHRTLFEGMLRNTSLECLDVNGKVFEYRDPLSRNTWNTVNRKTTLAELFFV